VRRRDRERAAAHLLEVARQCRVTLVMARRRWSKFEAHPPSRQVWIGPPTTMMRYMAALHEIGHIMHRVGAINSLVNEAAAWEWAFNNADEALLATMTDSDRLDIAKAWGSFFTR
jgi:hypothetical protein